MTYQRKKNPKLYATIALCVLYKSLFILKNLSIRLLPMVQIIASYMP